MSINIVLRIKPESGSLVKVISEIRNLGLSYIGQQIEELPESGDTKLTVKIDSSNINENEITKSLVNLDCVKAVEGFQNTQSQAKTKPDTDVLKVAALRVSDVYVTRTVDAYPKIMSIVANVEKHLRKASDRDDQLFAYGVAVGSHLANNEQSFPTTGDLSVVQNFVINYLTPLSTFEVAGVDLISKVSVFTRRYFNNMDMVFGSEFERCNIMSGIIQGMVNQAIPNSIVQETECRTNGDSVCRFHIESGR